MHHLVPSVMTQDHVIWTQHEERGQEWTNCGPEPTLYQCPYCLCRDRQLLSLGIESEGPRGDGDVCHTIIQGT